MRALPRSISGAIPVEQELYELLQAGLREARSPDELMRLMAEGRALGDDEAMRLVFPSDEASAQPLIGSRLA